MRKQLSQGENKGSVGTLARGLDILELFAGESPELTQTEISDRLGLPVPTVHRLVKLLTERGWLARDQATRRLRLGLGAARLLPAVRLPDLAREPLRALGAPPDDLEFCAGVVEQERHVLGHRPGPEGHDKGERRQSPVERAIGPPDIGKTDELKITPATRSGSRAASSSATTPPIELPASTTGPVTTSSRNRASHWRWSMSRVGRPAMGDRPKPGRSGVSTRPSPESPGATCTQLRWEPPSPWRSTNVVPDGPSHSR